ncbi:hypothetical protein PR202_gb16649 [Eleusine coracana subsp. coracana]|uniref:Uncharacterized protein n=1 Tax=Eleusine coracana subsp. coracana TaxID=191504 RepID=A0AAV5EYL7_ELECO|nr:hypothetical protein PR202_gb16649 [Eleusine coracana subsp. coracana]
MEESNKGLVASSKDQLPAAAAAVDAPNYWHGGSSSNSSTVDMEGTAGEAAAGRPHPHRCALTSAQRILASVGRRSSTSASSELSRGLEAKTMYRSKKIDDSGQVIAGLWRNQLQEGGQVYNLGHLSLHHGQTGSGSEHGLTGTIPINHIRLMVTIALDQNLTTQQLKRGLSSEPIRQLLQTLQNEDNHAALDLELTLNIGARREKIKSSGCSGVGKKDENGGDQEVENTATGLSFSLFPAYPVSKSEFNGNGMLINTMSLRRQRRTSNPLPY